MKKIRGLSCHGLQSSMDDSPVSDNLRKIEPKERFSTQDGPSREGERAGSAHLSTELMGNPHRGSVLMTIAWWAALMSLLPRGKRDHDTNKVELSGPFICRDPF